MQNNLLDWADKLYGQSISAVTKGVKSLLSGGKAPYHSPLGHLVVIFTMSVYHFMVILTR